MRVDADGGYIDLRSSPLRPRSLGDGPRCCNPAPSDGRACGRGLACCWGRARCQDEL